MQVIDELFEDMTMYYTIFLNVDNGRRVTSSLSMQIVMTCHSLCFERNVFLFHSLSNVRYTFFRAHGIAIRVI